MSSPFSPIKISDSLSAKNRIIRSATNDHLGNRDATVSDAQIEMYDMLARNEIGTIITGHLSVDPDIANRADVVQLSIGDDSYIEGLKRIPEKIHQYGSDFSCRSARSESDRFQRTHNRRNDAHCRLDD